MYIDKNQQVVFGNAYDLEKQERVPIPSDLVTQIFDEPKLVQHTSTNDHIEGILMVGERPMMVVANPILTSEKAGPINGSLIMGRYLSDQIIRNLSDQVKQEFSVHTLNSVGIPNEVKQEIASNQAIVKPISNDTLAGYIALTDLNDKPVLIVEAQIHRDVYRQGQQSVWYWAVWMIIAGSVVGTALMLFVKISVIDRMYQLNNEIKGISMNSLNQRLTVKNHDEISELTISANNMLEAIQQAQAQLERFVYIVSHDLRSPLTALRSYVAVLQEEIQEGDMSMVLNDLGSMEKITKNMGEMIDNLLILSRIKREARVKESVNLNDVLQKIEQNVSILAKENHIELVISPNFPTLQLFRQPIIEVFSNLISNAIKFTSEKESGRIEVGFTDQGEEYHFFVKDDGPGIPKDNLEKLFTLFFRDGKKAGSGIGLSVVKEYIQLHGGRVWVESVEGNGSTFWFSLPKKN
ncbi:hypothetical protein HGA91_00950 [candidate division WWE3 bacterium]|nr:hypothetical protein [candidate division WWE3 bacterium]